MSRWAQLSGVLIVLITAVVQVLFDPRITRRFIASSLIAFLVYAVYVGVGLAVALTLLPQGPAAAAGTTLSIIGWIGLGGLGLVRMAPSRVTHPACEIRRRRHHLPCSHDGGPVHGCQRVARWRYPEAA